jgi:hypothetical protein
MIRPFDRDLAEIAAGDWFWDEMEECPYCNKYVPYDELEGLIGTPSICFACRKKVKQTLLDVLLGSRTWSDEPPMEEPSMDGLGLA